jgi:hypothetical protein
MIGLFANVRSPIDRGLQLLALQLASVAVPVAGFAAELSAESEAEVAWFEQAAEGNDIFLSRRIDGRWQDPLRIVSDGAVNTVPTVVADQHGTSWVVWMVRQSDSVKLSFSIVEGEGVALNGDVPSTMVYNMAPSMAIDPAGHPWLVWSGVEGPDADIYFSRWDGVGWAAPTRINDNDDTPDVVPVIGIGHNGLPWVCWLGYDGEVYRQFCSRWTGARWTPERELPAGDPQTGLFFSRAARTTALPATIADSRVATVFERTSDGIQSWGDHYNRYYLGRWP